jgi:hypothetical protein
MAGVVLPEGKTLHRIDATTAAEQPEQHAGLAALVLEEELTGAEYKRNFQRVLQILMR